MDIIFSSATDWLHDSGLVLPTGFENFHRDDWIGEAPPDDLLSYSFGGNQQLSSYHC